MKYRDHDAKRGKDKFPCPHCFAVTARWHRAPPAAPLTGHAAWSRATGPYRTERWPSIWSPRRAGSWSPEPAAAAAAPRLCRIVPPPQVDGCREAAPVTGGVRHPAAGREDLPRLREQYHAPRSRVLVHRKDASRATPRAWPMPPQARTRALRRFVRGWPAPPVLARMEMP